MAKKRSSRDRNKKIAVVVLFSLLGLVLMYQILSDSPGGPQTRPVAGSNGVSPAASSQSRQPPAQPASASRQDAFGEIAALNLALLRTGEATAEIGTRGNIFVYYQPPPPKPAPPPPPPPIALRLIQPQTAVAGTPRGFTLTIGGKDLPADPQIIFGGKPMPTTRVGDSTVKTEVQPSDYASPRSLQVEVKSQSQPAELYSNPLPFIVQAAPEPPFKYVGRLGDQGLFEMAADKRIERLKVGGTIQGVWTIDLIDDTKVQVTHSQHGIQRTVPLQDKGR